MNSDPMPIERLQQLVAGQGFELVDAEQVGPATRRVIRLRIDRAGGSEPGAGVTTEDCRQVSRLVEAELEREGAVGPRYELEVSSPGIERPVRFAGHWRRYLGRDVKLKAAGVKGIPVATIVGVPDDEHVELEIGGERRLMAMSEVRRATLVVDWSKLG
ncbi:MAG TPA: hypothetical protein PLL69_08910 [Gemmatimonadales bacterium]|nr:hypothetical protein [Gemmatimonadales bacterium]